MPETGESCLVSVVLVNYRGADDTITCLRELQKIDWPTAALELICIDNASGDDSVAKIRAAVPEARVIASKDNTGFAGGCNLGASVATGQYLAFLNNDARPDRSWVRAAVDVLNHDLTIGAVASKVLDWDGERVDFVNGSLSWFGMGYKPECPLPDTGEWDQPKDVLFATGAAMFVRPEVFARVGGFDERYFMFFEDVDLGWRLNLLGFRVRFVPTSLAFHRHHASMNKLGQFREHYLLERNALMTIYKNYGEDILGRALPAALALVARRSVERGGVDSGVLDIRRPGGDDVTEMSIPKTTAAGLFAIDSFVDHLGTLAETRAELQRNRAVSDLNIVPLFRDAFRPLLETDRYLAGYDTIVQTFAVDEVMSRPRRILVVTGDTLAKRMAGPAIRAWHIAEALANEHEVRLISTNSCQIDGAPFEVGYSSRSGLKAHAEWADVVVMQGYGLHEAPWIKQPGKPLVCDIYDPLHLEQLEQGRDLSPIDRERVVAGATGVLNEQLEVGDFFLCASEKQRLFWLGQLAALGRVNPVNYDDDSSLDSLLAVVPFGMSESDPVQTRRAIKGAVPGIGVDDKVIIWAGGVYNWFDPLTLIRAVHAISQDRADVRLFFLGMKHPNPHVPEMRMAMAARRLSDQLGLTGRVVFFNEQWVEFKDRQNYLLDADIGVSTHFEHVETTFSFRTRILDYLWAGLPIVSTDGDTFADLIRQEGLGSVVPSEDVPALAAALSGLLDDAEFIATCRANVGRVRHEYTWSRVLQPLLAFCRNPRIAPDLRLKEPATVSRTRRRERDREKRQWKASGDLALARQYIAEGGARELLHRAGGRVRRVAREQIGDRIS